MDMKLKAIIDVYNEELKACAHLQGMQLIRATYEAVTKKREAIKQLMESANHEN